MNKKMVVAGILTLLQALTQLVVTALGLAQYACYIDFLRDYPMLIYIRLLYYHNPSTCGMRFNIGQSIDGMANQAFVILNIEPFSVTRTFAVNCIYGGLSIIWIITSLILMIGGARDNDSKRVRWPWVLITTVTCALDITASVTYANDAFYTKTLADIIKFIGGTISGAPGASNINTDMASWIMVILFSRFVVFFLMNLASVIVVIIDYGIPFSAAELAQLEATMKALEIPNLNSLSDSSFPSVNEAIPRPTLSQSNRRMKELTIHRPASVADERPRSLESLENSPERSPRTARYDTNKKRSVNFPENLLSLPQRLENMIAEQRRKLDQSVIDTSGRRGQMRITQSLPQLTEDPDQPAPEPHETSFGRRGTVADLQGQLPWAYIPSSAHRMRDQLPPDEDLPPVPLPDYNAIPLRKASVHRAASSLSSMTNRRNKTLLQSRGPALKESDVLY